MLDPILTTLDPSIDCYTYGCTLIAVDIPGDDLARLRRFSAHCRKKEERLTQTQTPNNFSQKLQNFNLLLLT